MIGIGIFGAILFIIVLTAAAALVPADKVRGEGNDEGRE